MRRLNWALALVVALSVVGSAARLRAEDKPADSAKPAKKEGKAKPVRLTKPWNEIASLSEDQKSKIADLHKKSLDEQKAAVKKEHEAIMAVLTEAQRSELTVLQEKEAADKKTKKPASGDAPKPAEKAAEK